MTLFSRRLTIGTNANRTKAVLALLTACLMATLLFPSVASAAPTCRGKPVTINMNTNGRNGNGTAGNDVILGTAGADTIRGNGGVDTICAGAGNDTIYGGGGSDRIRGEAGHDRIHAGSGADDVWGGSGNDTIYGQGGQDDIWGEDGNDTIQGNHQSDKLYGGNGDDIVAGADGKDRIYGDAGNDTLNGGNNTDLLFGGAGNDTLNGQAGHDTANGGPGSDRCVNTEVESNCGPSAPPTWTSNSSFTTSNVSFVDFVVDWCCIAGEADFYVITMSADGHSEPRYYTVGTQNTDIINTFQNAALTQGKTYNLTIVGTNAAGQSTALHESVTIPAYYAAGSNHPVAAGVEAPAATPATHGTAAAYGTASAEVCADAWVGPAGTEFGVALKSRTLSDAIATAVPWLGYFTGRTHTGDRYLELGSQATKAWVCHQNGRITENRLKTQACVAHPAADPLVKETASRSLAAVGRTEVTNVFECTIGIANPAVAALFDFHVTMTITQRVWIENGQLAQSATRTLRMAK